MSGQVQETLSEPYYVKYTFYDDQGNVITGVTSDNITTNGGGPRTNCNQVYQELPYIIPSGNTDYNTLYVGAGPRNISGITPSNAVQYTVQLFGKFTGTTSPIQPTPTPTPTPSSTPQTCPCLTYSVFNASLESQGVLTYRDCQNITRTLVVDPQDEFFVCVCNTNSWSIEGNLIMTYDSPCNIPSPTPTPTPSSTPCSCGEYEVDTTLSEIENPVLLYTFCDGTSIAYTMNSNQIYLLCGCVGTFSCSTPGVVITYAGPC